MNEEFACNGCKRVADVVYTYCPQCHQRVQQWLQQSAVDDQKSPPEVMDRVVSK